MTKTVRDKAVTERLRSWIDENYSGWGRFTQLEKDSQIRAQRWRDLHSGRQYAAPDMLEFVRRVNKTDAELIEKNQLVQKVARIYLRVSSDEQDLTRQNSVVEGTRAAGYYVASVYREKASGARADRPELLRMIADLQPGEVVIAEKIDRISRLPLPEAESLIASIQAKGARLAIPGIVDLSDLADQAEGVAKIVLEAVQAMLLKLALQMARDDYEDRRDRQRQGIELAKQAGKYTGRTADTTTHDTIIALRSAGRSIAETSKLAGCSESQVKRVWALRLNKEKPAQGGLG